MGCFLACFGKKSDSDHKRRKYRNQVQPRDHRRNPGFDALESPELSLPCESEIPVSSALEAREEAKEQPSVSPKKKVTFDSNVRTYEHVPTHKDSELLPESEDAERKKEKEKDPERPSLAKSSSEESSTISSVGSYPPNHRYQNCRDSDDDDNDDEEEELDFGDSDLDDEDEDVEDDGEIEDEDEIVEPKRGSDEEVNSPMPTTGFPRSEVRSVGMNQNARDRSGYVHSVLNPVENLTQWKVVKARTTTKMKPQKENFSTDLEPRISFSSEPTFKEFSSSFMSETIKPKQEMAVDASLSNWLVSPETTPVNKINSFAFDARYADKTTSQGSNSVRSQDDRPILGALTVEEIRQFSATSSPRKSPSRSPDDMPIIGSVGSYWSHKDSGSATSFKGIPNTTSKYKEDKLVNWHNTPFETRLERALNRGATEA